MLQLTIPPAPFDVPSMGSYELWQERTHLVDSHRWIRKLLRAVSRERLGGDTRPSPLEWAPTVS